MHFPSRSTLLFLAAVLVAPQAGAAVIFDSLADPTGALSITINFGTRDSIGASFSTDAGSPVTLTDVTVRLRSFNTSTTEQIDINLYSNTVGNVPDVSIHALATNIAGSSIATSFTDVHLSGINFSLAAGTRYWIVLSDDAVGDGDVAWIAGDPLGVGVAAEFQTMTTLDNAQSGRPFQMKIEVQGADPTVPEPASLALLGLGLAGLGFSRRRKA